MKPIRKMTLGKALPPFGWLVQKPKAPPPLICSWCGREWEQTDTPGLVCPTCDRP